MSTTTKRLAMIVPVVFALWIALMALVMRFSDAAPGAVILFPQANFLENLPENAPILGMNQTALILANRPELTRDLYAAGAWLVLPAGLTGCLPLSSSQWSALLRSSSGVSRNPDLRN